jgi:hypothetical protein
MSHPIDPPPSPVMVKVRADVHAAAISIKSVFD